ncbi:MAG: hypothetical protein WCD46_16010, partial [Desulfobacterales bacterium]
PYQHTTPLTAARDLDDIATGRWKWRPAAGSVLPGSRRELRSVPHGLAVSPRSRKAAALKWIE